ncbi:MAG: hypothetical protein OQJ89_14920, partial [Kangiellaceae bacterium]|nr:hypothetical protein [Kangiellaceae bacterium]
LYIDAFKSRGFSIDGYFFESRTQLCIERNQERSDVEKVLTVAIRATRNRLELPSYAEGFDNLYFVSIVADGFSVEQWKNKA